MFISNSSYLHKPLAIPRFGNQSQTSYKPRLDNILKGEKDRDFTGQSLVQPNNEDFISNLRVSKYEDGRYGVILIDSQNGRMPMPTIMYKLDRQGHCKEIELVGVLPEQQEVQRQYQAFASERGLTSILEAIESPASKFKKSRWA
ncbi:MAG: hypothetical protein VKJ04_08630 [Vampirovibrionales bacterium]|nr:hypothetical protein [Vampirovibrionales bacterium]